MFIVFVYTAHDLKGYQCSLETEQNLQKDEKYTCCPIHVFHIFICYLFTFILNEKLYLTHSILKKMQDGI